MIIKIGNVELSEEEADELYSDKKYIVTYRRVYALHYSNAQRRVYGSLVFEQKFKDELPLTKRGRFLIMSGKSVNKLLGFRLVNEE